MPDQVTIRERRVNLQSGDVGLEGHLAIPENSQGVIVFAHGSGSSRHSPRNRSVARRLNEARMATLLFDLLTEEEQARDQAGGQARFDILLLARRLIDAVDALATREETAGMKMGLFGASTGAAAALVTAAERPDRAAAVVARGGRPELAWQSLSRVTAPTLLIVGELDRPVIELNRRAYEQLQVEKRLEIVTGASHLFEEPGTLESVADLAAQWFARYLVARHAPEGELPVAAERKNRGLPNKREMIQAIVDDEPEPWIIMKPSRRFPTDPEPLCIFENPAAQTQARTEIPLAWFQQGELQKIQRAIQQSLRRAQVKTTAD